MRRIPSREMFAAIVQSVQLAKSKGATLDLYAVVNGIYDVHRSENIALEDIAEMIINDAAASNVPLILVGSWNEARAGEPLPAFA